MALKINSFLSYVINLCIWQPGAVVGSFIGPSSTTAASFIVHIVHIITVVHTNSLLLFSYCDAHSLLAY